jgi:surfactin synthase thioesterase subunit
MHTTSIPQARLTDDALVRLVCLPYAGGGSAVFHRWRSALPLRVDLVPLCLPGHDGRLAESPRTDLSALARELADDLLPALDRPYVLVGHSLGAWIGFELARELRRRNLPLPELLIVAAARPPHTELPQSPLHLLPADKFIAAMQRRYDGIPPAIAGNAELLQLLLPVLRADIQMVETYRYAAEPPLDVKVLALGGTEDPAVSAAQLADWRHHTSRNCSVRQFPGGHFFLFRGDNQQHQSTAAEPPSPALRTIIMSLQRYLHDNQFNNQSKCIEP